MKLSILALSLITSLSGMIVSSNLIYGENINNTHINSNNSSINDKANDNNNFKGQVREEIAYTNFRNQRSYYNADVNRERDRYPDTESEFITTQRGETSHFRDPRVDPSNMSYDRPHHRGDWDYGTNWRYNKHPYLSGEDQSVYEDTIYQRNMQQRQQRNLPHNH